MLRLAIGALTAAAVAVALVPLWILLDIRDGGTGWGLCAEGVGACRTTYFAGFEFVAGFLVVMFALLFLIRLCVRALRWRERDGQLS